LVVKHTKAKGRISELSLDLKARQNEIEDLEREVVRLRGDLQTQLQELQRFKPIQDVEAEAKRLRIEAEAQRDDLVQGARNRLDKAEEKLQSAVAEADRIVAMAKELTEAAQAMKNIIEGYGDAYIVPTYNLLDDLAEEFGFSEAGKELKQARESSRLMVKHGRSATCDYVEANRREIAIRFVTDAFNGKLDSILSRTKTDNHGKLEQEIRDAFALVNLNGSPFRNARITEEYLKARLEELKWAVTARALKEREREEQRQLREQMCKREKAQQQVAATNKAQRAELDARLAALKEQLKAAEEKISAPCPCRSRPLATASASI
jgi:chromosome segregation ATPase